MEIIRKRVITKYSTISGEEPTIPGSGVTDIYDNTKGGWLNTDIYVGETFINTADDKMWFRSDNGINLLGYSGMTSDFIDLGDTPSSGYTGYAGYSIVVNGSEDGLDFSLISSVSAFTDLSDTPATYVGSNGYYLTVDTTNTAITFSYLDKSFSGMTDVQPYTTSYDILMVNSSVTGLEFVDGNDYYVSLCTTQTINSAKTFDALVTLNNGLTLTQPLTFSGATEQVIITNISTNSGLTEYDNFTIPTSYAVRTYVDSFLINSANTTWVTLDTNQTIIGSKTFNAPVFYNSGLTVVDMNVSNDLSISGNTYNNITSYTYFGDASTDGSYRIFIDVTAALTIEKKIAGTWTFKASF